MTPYGITGKEWVNINRINNRLAFKVKDAVFYLITDDPMIACKYWSAKDKASGQWKVVYMLLTCHQPVMVDIANYWKGEPIVQKPYAVNLIQYNLYIGGVDQLDQQFYSVRILRKTCKWYRKLTLRLISQAVLNANKVFVKTHGLKDVTFLKFMHNTIVLTLQLPPNLN